MDNRDELLRNIFDSAMDGIFIIDMKGRYMEVNPAGCRMFGYAREEFLSSDIRLLLFPEDVEKAFQDGARDWGRGAFVPEYRMRRKDGGEVWVEMTVKPIKIGAEVLVLGIKRDITERRNACEAVKKAREVLEEKVRERTVELSKANEALRAHVENLRKAEEEGKRSTELLQGIIDNAMAVIQMKDSDGRYLLVNRWYEKIFNISRNDVIGKTVYERWPKEVADLLLEHDRNVVEAGEPLVFEESMPHSDGSVHTYITVKFPVTAVKGAVCGISTDITERKRVEEELKKSAEHLKAAQHIACLGSWDWDIAGNRLYWSDEIYRIFGLKPKEFDATYEAFLNSVHPDDRDCVKKAVFDALYRKEPYSIDHRIVPPDGVERIVHEQAEVAFDRDGKPVRMAGTVQDITERKMMEAEILKAQKLESIGVLAGGIAHDFNNLLLGIIGNLSLAKTLISPSDRAYSLLNDAEKAAQRSKDLTKQLLTFSRGGEPVREPSRIEQLARDCARLVLRDTDVGAEFSFPADLWPVEIDQGQISQVMNNVILNARQAMPEGGVIKISAENAAVGQKDKAPLKEGRYVRITVKDTGHGIPADMLPRIFDPFFTTKKKASGLGLAVSYSIVKKHRGHISAESAEGEGTAFNIYLPASDAPSCREDDKAVKGTGRVLVMDDEDMVRDVTGEMLKILGYEAVFAMDGGEAVDIFRNARKEGRPFDAVILDLTVPGGMGGKEAVKKLLEIDPGAKAIVSSGFAKDPVMSEYRKYGFKGVIAKPYRVAEFSKAVNKVLKGD